MTSPHPYPAPQQTGWAPVPPPRKRRVWPWVLLTLFVGMVVLFGGCAALVGGAAKSIDTASKTVHHVTYQVESTRAATVSYDTSTAGGTSTATATDVASGWSTDVDYAGLLGPNLTVSLSPDLTRTAQKVGTVTCRILAGGKIVKEASAKGQFASVSCFATGQDIETALRR